jgi:AcrR family transcriptional regulator
LNQREKSQRTNALLLDAAASEFAVRGFAGTTLKDIVTRTGMTKGALYAHFDSKESMANVLAEHAARVWSDVSQAVVGSRRSGLRGLDSLVHALVDLLGREVRVRAVMRLMVEDAHVTGRVSPLLQEMSDLVECLLRQAQREGEVDSRQQVGTLSQLVLATLLGSYYIEPALTREERVGDRTRAIWATLMASLRGGRAAGAPA